MRAACLVVVYLILSFLHCLGKLAKFQVVSLEKCILSHGHCNDIPYFRDVECAAHHCRTQDLRHKVLRLQSQVKRKEFQCLCGQGTTRLTVDKLKQ